MNDRRAQFDQFLKTVEEDHQAKMEALFVLFPEFGGDKKVNPIVRRTAKQMGTALGERTNKEIAETIGKECCEFAGCDKRLRSDSKKCGGCSKRVCFKHWNRPNDSCAECASVPA